MKPEKLSLHGIKNVLSRAEMKKIMAGSGSGLNCCWCNNGTVQPIGGASASNNTGCMQVCQANGLNGGVYLPNKCTTYGT